MDLSLIYIHRAALAGFFFLVVVACFLPTLPQALMSHKAIDKTSD
jgi:hypothetical protein